ncbi:dirigent protein 1-like [Salvia divinorum]|uniref:Dirigent protein n=1 Tax=Salvia divinorum TaxID=28513 RepID=A0ABD1HDR3_SALDI
MAKAPTFSLISILSLGICLPTNSQNTKLSNTQAERTHLHFYAHKALRGDVTAVVVAQAATSNTYRYRFGEMTVFDDRLTEGPNLSSRVVGRAQGMYASADISNPAYLSVYNLVFTEWGLNGSTLSILGRYASLSAERELPVVGGTRNFRFARGHARIRTYLDDLETGRSVDEYDVYVMHS